MNSCTIIGNLARDPETRTTSTEKQVCSFTVVVNRRARKGGDQQADFFKVDVWGAMADPCQKYLAKGRKVCVCGPVSVDTYTGHDGKERSNLRIFAQTVEFLSPRSNDDQPQEGYAPEGYAQVTDEALPF